MWRDFWPLKSVQFNFRLTLESYSKISYTKSWNVFLSQMHDLFPTFHDRNRLWMKPQMINEPLKESAMMPSSESLSNISQSLRPGECIIRHVESSEVEDVSLLKNPYASEWFIIKLIFGVIKEWISSMTHTAPSGGEISRSQDTCTLLRIFCQLILTAR